MEGLGNLDRQELEARMRYNDLTEQKKQEKKRQQWLNSAEKKYVKTLYD